MGLFRKGKTCIIAKFHRTNLVICSLSREGKTLSYSASLTVAKHLSSFHGILEHMCFTTQFDVLEEWFYLFVNEKSVSLMECIAIITTCSDVTGNCNF